MATGFGSICLTGAGKQLEDRALWGVGIPHCRTTVAPHLPSLCPGEAVHTPCFLPFPLGKENAAFLTLSHKKSHLHPVGSHSGSIPGPRRLQERHLHRAGWSPSRPRPPFSFLPLRISLLLFLVPDLHAALHSIAAVLLPSCGTRENEISLSRGRRDLENGEDA